MMKLDALFVVRNGTVATGLDVRSRPFEYSIPFLRPASTQQRTIAGWVCRRDVDSDQIFEPETLFVSTDGEGSHTHAYVASFEFVCNSNVSVLLPRVPMSIQEKLFYARCITL